MGKTFKDHSRIDRVFDDIDDSELFDSKGRKAKPSLQELEEVKSEHETYHKKQQQRRQGRIIKKKQQES